MSSDERTWREKLTPQQYAVLREQATEPAFSGSYWDCDDDGTYHCAGCGSELFSSETKFDSGSGWPSFSEPVISERVDLREDNSLGISRIEVVCRNCGGHLGHVFDDGPAELTGKRYCINSCALRLESS